MIFSTFLKFPKCSTSFLPDYRQIKPLNWIWMQVYSQGLFKITQTLNVPKIVA